MSTIKFKEDFTMGTIYEATGGKYVMQGNYTVRGP